MAADDGGVYFYENCVPAFIGSEMERLYEHVHSSLPQFTVYGDLRDNTCAYVAQKGDKVTTALLFKRNRNEVRVLNEQISIGSEEINRFAQHIFDAYKTVGIITFHAVRPETSALSYPHQRFNCSEDIVVTLPDSREKYVAGLGKNTRRNVKRYMDRLLRCFPTFRYEFYDNAAVDEEQLRQVISFNRARMAGKQKLSTIDDDEANRIIRLAKTCGMVGIATIDGRVCAGGIGYRTGENYFLNVIAHDPAYDNYWIGILCCYLSICECIARHCKEFHFLWGRYDYKFALGAVQRDLDHLVIYRSWAHYLLNGFTALRVAFDGYLRVAKFWMLEQERQPNHRNFVSRAAALTLNGLRSAKRLAAAASKPIE